MLEASDLTKRYEDGLLALDHLNLRVDKGELFCLLGANGAGKTTTINLFLNFIEPTEGRALINGIDVSQQPVMAKSHVSYVPEQVMLYGNFSARQNLEFFARLAGRTGMEKEDYYQVLHAVGLPEDSFEQRTKKFSKGMRQKLGIAIAVIKDAPAVLLDEPTSGLDPKSAAEFMALLLNLRDRGRAIFMSTHDIFRARQYADRVGIMSRGVLLSILEKRALANADLEEVYLNLMSD